MKPGRIPCGVISDVYAIVLDEDGVEWTQQCGGYACHQNKGIGYLVWLNGEDESLTKYFTGPKWGGWCCDGIDNETADFVESVVPDFKVDRTRMSESCEAWIIGS